MARQFDYGKASYGASHRPYVAQPSQTRHILADSMLQHYGASPGAYSSGVAHYNYRMGSEATNSRDSRLDSHIMGEVFHDAGRGRHGMGYDAQALTRDTAKHAGLSYQQQRDGVGQRFDTAKRAYDETGDYKYYMMQKDLRGIAEGHLDCDMRSFRLSSRK